MSLSTTTANSSAPALAAVGRLLLSIIFILSGFLKLTSIAGTAGYFGSLGLPAPTALAVAVGLLELIGGVLILVGFQTRYVAIVLAVFTVATAFIGHFGQGGQDATLVMMNQAAFLKNLAIAGGFLVLAAFGPGSLSIDARR